MNQFDLFGTQPPANDNSKPLTAFEIGAEIAASAGPVSAESAFFRTISQVKAVGGNNPARYREVFRGFIAEFDDPKGVEAIAIVSQALYDSSLPETRHLHSDRSRRLEQRVRGLPRSGKHLWGMHHYLFNVAP